MKTKLLLMAFSILSIIACKKKEKGDPSIKLTGSNSMNVILGGTFSDPGAKAYDADGNAVTVSVTGSVDPNSLGNYVLTYKASANGQALSVKRTVKVIMDASVAIGTYQIQSDCNSGSSLPILGSDGNTITVTASGSNGLTLDHPDASNAGVTQNRDPYTGTISGSDFNNVTGTATISAFGSTWTYNMTGTGHFSSNGDTLTIDYSWPNNGNVNSGICTAQYIKQ